jgi:hypothetical protein
MTDEHWIAGAKFVLVGPDDTRTPVQVQLAAPRSVGDDEWTCAVSVTAFEEISPVSGADSLQALGLAWRLAGMLLASLETGDRHLEFETGEAVPLAAYFGDPLTPPAAPDQAI